MNVTKVNVIKIRYKENYSLYENVRFISNGPQNTCFNVFK